MLAYQPEEVIKKIAAGIARHTDRTVAGACILLAELRRVRELGYSMNRGEWSDSVRGVAAPIMDSSGKVIAAVGVFGPAERLNSKKLQTLAATVKKTGIAISRALGYRPGVQAVAGS